MELLEEENYPAALQALEEKTRAGFQWRVEVTNGYQYGFFAEALKGVCLEKMGDVVKSYRAYQNERCYCEEEKVSTLGTPSPAPKLEVYVGIGRMCNEAGRWTDSLNYLDAARMEAAEYTSVAIAADRGLIKRTVEIGEYEESIKFLRKVGEMNYGDGSLYVLLKDSYVALGDSTMAEKVLQEGFQKFPKDNTIIVELINYYISIDNAAAALNYLDLAKKQEPENAAYYFAEGTLYERIEELEKAKEAYRKSLELDPDFFDVNFNMGVMYYNEAVLMLEKANEIMEVAQYEKARDEAFEVLKKSIPYLEKCHSINPDDNNTMETLRILYYRLGIEDKLTEMNKKLGRETTP